MPRTSWQRRREFRSATVHQPAHVGRGPFMASFITFASSSHRHSPRVRPPTPNKNASAPPPPTITPQLLLLLLPGMHPCTPAPLLPGMHQLCAPGMRAPSILIRNTCAALWGQCTPPSFPSTVCLQCLHCLSSLFLSFPFLFFCLLDAHPWQPLSPQ